MTDTAETAALPLRRPHDNQYLAGNYAAVESEVTAHDLAVVGEIPVELEGRWLRNGPNPESVGDPALHHWFLGTGMVHGVRLRGGKGRSGIRNRFVLNADGPRRWPLRREHERRRFRRHDVGAGRRWPTTRRA